MATTPWYKRSQVILVEVAVILVFCLYLQSDFADDQTAHASQTDQTANPLPPNKQAADLIVQGDYLVSMIPGSPVITDAAVAIKDGVILGVGSATQIADQYHSKQVIPGEQRIIMPGLINGHSHAAMTLLRGVAEDLALMDWLNNYIFPAEVEFVDADFVRIGAELACWEMIRSGTTTFVDMYYFPDETAKVVERCGMRAMIATTVIDQTSPDAENAADAMQKGLAYIERWKEKNSRITPIFGPHANYTLNAEQLIAVNEAAEKANVGISIHMSESLYELENSKKTYGKPSIEMFESIGFLDRPVIAAHVIWPTSTEMPILVNRNVGVIYNPTSNMKIASGIAPIADLLEAGAKVGLGTDGAASNNDLDMWEEMRLAALLQKVAKMDPQVLPAKSILNMATLGGAQAIGLGEKIGSLEVGKRADLIQVSTEDVHFIPMYDPISHLVYVADAQDVTTVIVDGRILMRDRDMLTIDTKRVKTEAHALARRIQKALNERQTVTPDNH